VARDKRAKRRVGGKLSIQQKQRPAGIVGDLKHRDSGIRDQGKGKREKGKGKREKGKDGATLE
jgi:hypothetical protein